MQTISSLDSLDQKVPIPFASNGYRTVIPTVAGISDSYATSEDDGGLLLTRGMVNYIGFIASLDSFLSSIGSLRTYINGITYQKYSKLEYVDDVGTAHELFAKRSGLSNFNNDQSLINDSNWCVTHGSVMNGFYFN